VQNLALIFDPSRLRNGATFGNLKHARRELIVELRFDLTFPIPSLIFTG